MAKFATLDDLDVAGKRVLLRLDLNVPMKNGEVTDATRIERAVPTVTELADNGARVVIMSHFGRPKGKVVPDMSLGPVVAPLSAALGQRLVSFAVDCVGDKAAAVVDGLTDGEIAVLENLRFHPGEEANDSAFAGQLAALGDLYVNDAFSAAHRAHASTEGIAKLLPAAAGRAMEAELNALERALATPERPVAALVGGAKVSTKLAVLNHLIDKVDCLIIGGGMANTFLHAEGVEVGRSLCEHDMAEMAREIVDAAEQSGCEIMLPRDVVLAHELKPNADTSTVVTEHVAEDMMILDVGPRAVADLIERLRGCRTLIWNGPLGAFETAPFDQGTNEVARAAAELTKSGSLVSVAGGGDTVAALNNAGVAEDFSYVSTAGGAFLEWLEGRPLPGVVALHQ